MIRVLEPNKDYIIRADKNGIVDDVIEYKHGYWVQGKESSRCSECNCTLAGQALWMYCPNCGAKMDEIEEDLIMPQADGSTIPKSYMDEVEE